MKHILFLITLIVHLPSLFSQELSETIQKSNTPRTKLEIQKLSNDSKLLLRAQKTVEAAKLAEKIFELSPLSPESNYIQGQIYFVKKDYHSAIMEFNKAIDKQENHEPSLFMMGLSHFKLNLWRQSLKFFEKACIHSSYNPYYRYNLTLAYYLTGNFDKAKIEAEKTIELKENYYKVKVLLLKSLIKLNQKQEAYKLAHSMYEKNIELESILTHYANLQIDLYSNYKTAIDILKKKKSLSPIDRRLLAISYMETGNYSTAISNYKILLGSNFNLDEDSSNYLKCLVLSGRKNDAEKLLKNLIQESPLLRTYFIDIMNNLLEGKELFESHYSPL